MYSTTFSLKSPNSRKESLIYMFVFFNKEKIKLSTKQQIPVALWDQKIRAVTKNGKDINRYLEKHSGIVERLQSVQEKLNELEKEVDRFNLDKTLNRQPFTLSGLRQHLSRILDAKNWGEYESSRLLDFLKVFIKQITSGYRKQPNTKRYSIGTIKNYRNLFQAIERFEIQIRKQLHWDTIDKQLYYSFLTWHEQQGYSRNYVGKHIKDLKAIMKIAFEDGIHTNTEFQKRYFISPKDSIKKIPLTLVEIQKMSNLDLSDNLGLSFARDIFLLGAYLGLRVSDIKRISPECVHSDQSGKYISIKTKKTETDVRVPLNSKANEILEKYGYRIPPFWEQVVNRKLKKIALKIDLPASRASKLTLHISRHTFSKLSYEFGIPALYIMKITGHATERSFMRYINIAPEQAVEEFRKHEYFR